PATPPAIVTNGLVLNLDAGNSASYPGTGTTWTDLSGNGNNGTLINGPTYSSSNGGSIVFDGTNDSVNIPISSSLQSQYFTLDAWFKLNSIDVVNGSPIFTGHYQSYGTISGSVLTIYSGQYLFQTRLSNTCCQSLYVGTASTNTWVNFTGTWNGTTKIAYLNGVQIGTQSTSGTHSQLNNISIGNNSDNIAVGNYSNALNGWTIMSILPWGRWHGVPEED
ncbi:hypothetical protein EBU71_03030, partial [bacterium]|nr:hypothetical protein [Candidatus Elulimicrobium humile]